MRPKGEFARRHRSMTGDEHGQREEVKRNIVVEIDLREAEAERQPGDVQKPVLAAGQPVQLDGAEPEHLAVGDRQEGEVDAAPVRDQGADQGAGHAGRQRRGEQAAPQAHRDIVLEQPEGIGADAEKAPCPKECRPP